MSKKRSEEEAQDEPLYGDKPTFSYTPRDGGEPIVFPSHSTIRGEVDGRTYLEFIWDMGEARLTEVDQIFAYLRRSGAMEEMKRRVLRLPTNEITPFFRAWVSEGGPLDLGSLPPES